MEKFTASNDSTVERCSEDSFRVTNHNPRQTMSGLATTISRTAYLDQNQIDGLREFFLNERDHELGRWRWPENPDYVVYPKKVAGHTDDQYRECTVFDERSGVRQEFGSDLPQCHGGDFREAARSYFAAHPAPKPWHGAKPGEVWVLTGAGGMEQPWRRMESGLWISCTTGMVEYNDEYAIAGRRIWPEVVSDG